MKFCGKCGAKNRDDVRFCVKCGTEFVDFEEDGQQDLDSPSTAGSRSSDVGSENATIAEVATPALSDFKPGMILGKRYELIRELGRGG